MVSGIIKEKSKKKSEPKKGFFLQTRLDAKTGEAMPIKTIKDGERGFTENVVIGRVTAQEVLACQTTFFEAGPTRLLLWDLSAADLTLLTAENMLKFVSRTASLGRERQDGRTAIVAPAPLQYGFGRMAEAFGEMESISYSLRVFRKRDDAIRWLELSDRQPADSDDTL
jgi:hypothetical protein